MIGHATEISLGEGDRHAIPRGPATICGLPYDELRKKELNRAELARILADLPTFGRNWTPRTFIATARKIKELEPGIDLYERLRDEDQEVYEWLMEQVDNRPDAIVIDENDEE